MGHFAEKRVVVAPRSISLCSLPGHRPEPDSAELPAAQPLRPGESARLQNHISREPDKRGVRAISVLHRQDTFDFARILRGTLEANAGGFYWRWMAFCCLAFFFDEDDVVPTVREKYGWMRGRDIWLLCGLATQVPEWRIVSKYLAMRKSKPDGSVPVLSAYRSRLHLQIVHALFVIPAKAVAQSFKSRCCCSQNHCPRRGLACMLFVINRCSFLM